MTRGEERHEKDEGQPRQKKEGEGEMKEKMMTTMKKEDP